MDTIKKAIEIIHEIVSSNDKFDCEYLSDRIFQKSQDDTFSADIRKYLNVIYAITSYHFKPEKSNDPYGPRWQTHESRSPIPEDLTEEKLHELDALSNYLCSVSIIARVYDVLWLRRRKVQYAELAIKAYKTCANLSFDLEHWTYCANYLERALRLSSLFRRKSSLYAENVADHMIKWIKVYADSDKSFLTSKLVELLLEFGYGEVPLFHGISIDLAQKADEEGDYYRAEKYWEIAVKAAKKIGDENLVNKAQSFLAESYIANARTESASKMNAAHFIQQAIEAYRKVPKSKEKCEELYRELLEFQKASLSELGKFELEIDITEIVCNSVNSISGKPLREALVTLAFHLLKPPDYDKLAKQAMELDSKYPLFGIAPAIHLDGEGKIIAKSKGNSDNTQGVSDRELFHLARLEHQYIIQGAILPAVDVFIREHGITENDILSVIVNNQFVCPGQEKLYSKGIYSGFIGDYVVSTSILIPLVENSMRYILRENGVRVSTLNPLGFQEELRLSAILEHEITLKIFGYNIVQDLKGLLLDRTYGNLRNNVSHGLATYDSFYHIAPIYFWWLVLRLILTPHYKTLTKTES